MTQITLPYRASLAAGQTERVAEVLANLDAILAVVNGDLRDDNLNAAAAIAAVKLAPGANGQFLQTTGGVVVWGAAPTNTIYRKVTEKDVVNSVAETDLLNGEITIGAGVMSTNKTCRVTLIGDLLNNTATGQTARVRVKFGGTTLFDSGVANTITANANRQAWRLDMTLANLGANNAQFLEGVLTRNENHGAPTTGIGGFSASSYVYSFGTNGNSAIDTSVAQTLVVTVELSVASANLSWRLKYGLVEVI